MAECAIMIAIATAISVFKLIDMPYGGSVTLAAMLPIAIIAYRHGIGCGMSTALVASALQLLLGLENFSYVTGWKSVVALALFDYVIAYAGFGLGGIFKRIIGNRALALASGATLANLIRYICHVISGATIWAGLPIPDAAALSYSVSYNAVYMIPEIIITVIIATYLGYSIDFTKSVPTRVKSEGLDSVSSWCLLGAGLAAASTLVTDTVLVFSHLQLPSGEFSLAGLADVNWLAVGIVTLVGALIISALVLTVYFRTKRKKA